MTILANPLYASRRFDTIAALTASGLTYASGSVNTVVAGNRVEAEGLQYEVAPSGAVDQHLTTAGGARLYRVTQRSVEVTVGSGGQFSTINAAITYLDGQRRTYGSNATATIRLLAGFTMSEQVMVNGEDLGWVAIVSDAAVVPVNPSGITQVLNTLDGARPIFGATNQGVLPVIGALFAYASNATAWDGVAVYGGSTAQIQPGCGVQRCRRGIQVYNNSKVFCNMDGLRSEGGSATTQLGVDFRECLGRALDVQQGSHVSLPRSNFNDCGGDVAVYVIWGSTGNIYQSSVRRAAGTAIHARDGSVLCARECDMDQAGNRAVHALHGALIDARHSPSSGFGTFGAVNCLGSIAVLASAGSIIEAADLPVTGALARGFSAGDGSVINASNANAQNCGSIGFMAERGSTINAHTANASGCQIGFQSIDASTINAGGGAANNCTQFGVLAVRGSNINAQGLSATGCDRAVEVREGSKINVRDSVLTGSTSRALSVIDGGEVNCHSANTTGAVGFHLTVRGGAKVAAFGFNGAIDLRDGGGVVHNSGGTGAVSQTVNTLTAQGIIFR